MVLIPLRQEPPLDPDAPDARRWLQDELAKPEYRAAEPNAFDLAVQALLEWLGGLFAGAGLGIPGPVLALIAVLAVAIVVVIALLVFGVPRLQRRRRGTTAALFDEDRRSLDELRGAARAAAASGDWALAIEERFRAVVRGLVDRELVRVHPGTTAQTVAAAAAGPFPGEASALREAATEFDRVRYLGRAGDEAAYERVSALDERMSAALPALVASSAGAIG